MPQTSCVHLEVLPFLSSTEIVVVTSHSPRVTKYNLGIDYIDKDLTTPSRFKHADKDSRSIDSAKEFIHFFPVNTTLQAGRPCGTQPICGETIKLRTPIPIVTTFIL